MNRNLFAIWRWPVSTLANPDFINARVLTLKVCIVHLSGMANKLCTGRICDAKIYLGYRKDGNQQTNNAMHWRHAPQINVFPVKRIYLPTSVWLGTQTLPQGGWVGFCFSDWSRIKQRRPDSFDNNHPIEHHRQLLYICDNAWLPVAKWLPNKSNQTLQLRRCPICDNKLCTVSIRQNAQ